MPDWKLERYHLGELNASGRREVEVALASDASVRARLAALEKSDAEILRQHPRLKLKAVSPPAPRWWLPPLAVAAAALLFVVLWPRTPDEDEMRLKGGARTPISERSVAGASSASPSLRVYRRVGASIELLADGSAAQAHDLLQIGLDVGSATHCVVLSLDGLGHVTTHWPVGAETKVPAGFQQLPAAFELDAAPGFERFVLLTSNAPLSPTELAKALLAAGERAPLAVANSVQQQSFRLVKTSR